MKLTFLFEYSSYFCSRYAATAVYRISFKCADPSTLLKSSIQFGYVSQWLLMLRNEGAQSNVDSLFEANHKFFNETDRPIKRSWRFHGYRPHNNKAQRPTKSDKSSDACFKENQF